MLFCKAFLFWSFLAWTYILPTSLPGEKWLARCDWQGAVSLLASMAIPSKYKAEVALLRRPPPPHHPHHHHHHHHHCRCDGYQLAQTTCTALKVSMKLMRATSSVFFCIVTMMLKGDMPWVSLLASLGSWGWRINYRLYYIRRCCHAPQGSLVRECSQNDVVFSFVNIPIHPDWCKARCFVLNNNRSLFALLALELEHQRFQCAKVVDQWMKYKDLQQVGPFGTQFWSCRAVELPNQYIDCLIRKGTL